MKIAIGSDHGGYALKNRLIESLRKAGHKVEDFGTHSKESCDYPLIGFSVAKAVADERAERGILVCRTGVGMTVMANKVQNVRAGACYDVKMAASSREHNDTNVLVLAADYTDFKKSKAIVKVWLDTKHGGERHARRVRQIKDLEAKLRGK